MKRKEDAVQEEVEVSAEEQAAELKQHEPLKYSRLMVFTSPTCGPCKQLKPALEEIAQEQQFLYEVLTLDESNRDTFIKYGVKNVPAMVHFEVSKAEEKEIGRMVGYQGQAHLKMQLAKWGYIK